LNERGGGVAIGEGDAIPKARPRRRSLLGRAWKRFGQSRRVRLALGSVAASYIRLVGATNRLIYEGSVDYQSLSLDRPVIITIWHGQHLMLPAVRRKDHRVVALISRHHDGDLNAIVAEKLGVETVRGSAARDQSLVIQRGGISGFLKLRSALREGKSVTLTADLSKAVADRPGGNRHQSAADRQFLGSGERQSAVRPHGDGRRRFHFGSGGRR
jgi:hypothetical protein